MTNVYESRVPLPADCVRLERELAEFLDGTLDAARSEWVADHLGACARCAAVLESLGEPSAVGAAVAALPGHPAPAHLWNGVAERIAAPVVEIGGQRRAPSAERAGRRGWWRTGLAAAGLVVATAGVTYTLTRQQQQQTMPTQVAAAPRAVTSSTDSTPNATMPNATTPNATTPSATAPDATAPQPDVSPAAGNPTVTAVANRSPLGARRSTVALPADPERETYDREIAKLRVVLKQRRGDLDTSTVRVVTQSLKVIDQAIAQSKAALAKDPASGFLNKQLNNALDQKLELLRTAALLPSRT